MVFLPRGDLRNAMTNIFFQHAAIHPQKPKFLPANFTLLPEKLKEVGYTTHIVGK